MSAIVDLFEGFVLAYLAVFAASGAALTYIGVRAMASRSKKMSAIALKDLLVNDYYEAVSVLVPAYNSEETIVDTVRSLLNLQHPQFDITVVNDGSTDDTLERLVAYFALVEVPIAHENRFETQPLNVMYRSLDHANLTVIDKDHGGRADALNAALNLARRALVCVVDADVVLDPTALAAASRRFVEDETVAAVTGLVRPDEQSLGRRRTGWVQRFQEAGHARRTAAAAGWGAVGAGMDAEGFVIYRRRSVLEIGGWTTSTDAETLLALHRLDRARKEPYRVVFTSDPVGHMQPEAGVRGLLHWRARRTRALVQVLWGERRMLLRPRYGKIGMLSTPYRWIFDLGSNVVELAAYAYLAASAIAGAFDVTFALAFVLLGPGSRIIVGQLATASDALANGSPATASERLKAFAATVVEQLGVAQLSMVGSVVAMVRNPRRAQVTDALSDNAFEHVGS